jgi:hypothetical protein
MFNVEKKLREAQFFLEKMREREGMAFGDPEVFDFLLSAFLNAVRTVDYRLRHEQRTYPDWRDKTWNVANPMEDSRLQFLSSDRRVEVHESGSARIEQWKTSKVAPGDTYTDPSGRLEVFGSPPTLTGVDTGATVRTPKHVFRIDGSERPVIQVCDEGLAALSQMVADYIAQHP